MESPTIFYRTMESPTISDQWNVAPIDFSNNHLERLTMLTSDDKSSHSSPKSNEDQMNDEKSESKAYQINNRRNNRAANSPLLPPCRICGDRSSGFHYGATTCEACKGFFRRTLYRTKEFTCFKGTYDCDVMAPKKAPCPGCRYKKCIEAGLSRDGVKRGRYSLSRKTFNIMEVKGLQSHDLSPAPSKLVPNKLVMQALAPCSTTAWNNTAKSSASRKPLSPSIYTKNISTDMTKTTALQEYEKRRTLTDTLRKSFNKYRCYSSHIMSNLKNIQEHYVDVKHEHCEFFGPWDLVDTSTFHEFYKSTGIDVDYRITFFKDRFITIEQSICNLIDFAKCIPGFQDIALSDQITLVKSVQFHWWFLCSYPAMSNEHLIYTASSGDCTFKHEMQRFTGVEFGEMAFSMAGLFSSLQLDETERALVIALCVFSSDYAVRDLEDLASIDVLHQQIGEALYFYIKAHKDSSRFGHIISALTSLRSAEGLHIEGRNRAWKIFEESNFQIDVPPLMMELWAGLIPSFNPEQIMNKTVSNQSPQKSLLVDKLQLNIKED